MPERDRHDLAALGRIGDHAQIDFAFHQILVNLVRAQVFEMDVDGRIVAQKLGQVGRELVKSDAVHSANPNRACHHRPNLAQAILQLHEAAHDLLAGGVENLARGSWFDSSSPAFYQSAIVFFLQAPNLLADRRLGYKVLRGGIRKASTFDYVAENL